MSDRNRPGTRLGTRTGIRTTVPLLTAGLLGVAALLAAGVSPHAPTEVRANGAVVWNSMATGGPAGATS
ncbi:hypothetical protein NX794_04005 [Streptomyces sp. LP11]|uniref:Uncharacterized protein n=1 Tax=Streptomyces pyxinicus TaxID=2970331 RepID=A0ABT2AVW4_9ACTN|nr:hypothetical protein [Streptomyces sp. LP11]MCS0600398.1 hypothetical protein [Streptomyces sp. LP11]